MSTDPAAEAYQQQLMVAMRMHDVPGPRIAEALAEVHSHLAETGEDPREAFGDPKSYARSYADQLSTAKRGNGIGGRPGLLGPMTWHDGMYALVSYFGAVLFTDGFFSIVTGDKGFLRLPAVASTIVGLVLVVALAVGLVRRARRDADPVIDPRTGKDLNGPVPAWVIAALVAVPCGTLLLAYIVVVAGR